MKINVCTCQNNMAANEKSEFSFQFAADNYEMYYEVFISIPTNYV